MLVDLQLLPYHHKKSEIPDSSFLLAIMSPPTQTEFVYFFFYYFFLSMAIANVFLFLIFI